MTILKPGIAVNIRGASGSDVQAVIDKCLEIGAIRGIDSGSQVVKYSPNGTVYKSNHVDGYDVITIDQALGRTALQADNGWHERGELPPVECVCEINWGNDWKKCEIKAHVNQCGCASAIYQMENGWGFDSRAEKFRPIKTERELFVERFCSDNKMSELPMDLFAGVLYDKGLRYAE